MSDMYLSIIFLVVGTIILVRSGIYIVRSLSQIARFLGINEFTVAFILMAFVTSLPEFAVGINSAFLGNPILSLGNIIGTNIVNLTLILGLIAVIVGNIRLDHGDSFMSYKFFNFLLVISPIVLLWDGILSRADGLLLILLFLWNLDRLFNLRQRFRKRLSDGNFFRRRNSLVNTLNEFGATIRDFFNNILIFTASIIALLVASYLIVVGAEGLTNIFGLPEILVGIFVIGLGTSLPELSFGVRSAQLGKGGMSLGNLFGSSVINSTLILGVTALIAPISIESGMFWIGGFFMAFSMLLVYYFLHTKGFLSRREGLWLIFIYIIFILIETVFV